MSKYRFTLVQRYALWQAYEMKCFYCNELVSFREITIDHVIPEYYINQPGDFEQIKNEYGLDQGFSINGYENWVPSHNGCNIRKREELFSKTTLLYYLSLVQKKLPEVKDAVKYITQTRQEDKIIAALGTAIETNTISKDDVIDLLNEIEYERTRGEPLVLIFNLLIEDLSGFDLPNNIIQERYAILCDWLEEDLVSKIKSISSFPFHYAEASSEKWKIFRRCSGLSGPYG